jgi:O-acetyl-ADP-ribose deacetylase (regulator of RNase III)
LKRVTSPVTFLNGRVRVLVGDIVAQHVDAIVNAANSTVMGGGGVDHAIHKAGGSQILDACREIRATSWPSGLPVGEAVITTGGRLPARYVIHTVGPRKGIFGDPDADALLASCYRKSLQLAVEHDLATIAFPAISTGVFAFPKHEAAEIASATIEDVLAKDRRIQEVRLMFFTTDDANVFLKHQLFEPAG